MGEEKIKELNTRLLKEMGDSKRSPLMKGASRGEIDVFDFSFFDYEKLVAIFQKYKIGDPDYFLGDEPEIRELYNFLRERCRKRTITVKVKKQNGGEDIQGTYKVTFSKEVLSDPLDQVPEQDQPSFLKGWIGAVGKVAKELDKQLNLWKPHFSI